MKNKFYFIFLILFFSIIFFIFYKGLKNSNIYQPNKQINKEIPVFKAKLFDSDFEINSQEFFKKKNFYLVNIWASWCVPCRNEHSFLVNLSNEKKLEIVGLNYKDNIVNAKSFLKELGNPYKKIISDKDGTIAIEWGAYGVPETFLIYNNKIIKQIIGPIDNKQFKEIKNLIK